VEQRALRLTAELCSTYTPAGREAALLPKLEAELRRLGAEVRAFPLCEGRANILATWGDPLVLFSSHLDVVPPDLPVRLSESKVEARGACDAKGQIAAQLGAIELLLGEGLRGLAWLGVAGEESDSIGARASLELAPSLASLRAIVVGEPTACLLATGQKGFQRIRLTCHGKTAHGGTPELGENAILKLMDWIAAVRAAEGASDAALGREAWNVGLVSGGRAGNVVPDLAQAELTLRTIPGGRLRPTLERARPSGAEVESLVEDPWDFFDAPEGFPSASVPFGSDLPTMRALAPKAAAILAGPGRAALAHTGIEELGREEMAEGIELFAALGRHYIDGRTE
jgi:Acetylornithine deacetylase/Succinyl-diaminopimelate desuccinylase and related deacylases